MYSYSYVASVLLIKSLFLLTYMYSNPQSKLLRILSMIYKEIKPEVYGLLSAM